jgi:predicted branched-subunit amino acid permease
LKSDFFKGAYHGIPIALGYLSVSFGFGILAVKSGLSILSAAIISITNLTSAGQVAGVGIIATGGTILEMILTQLIINIRYALMALSLSQKLDNSFNTPKRLIASYGITDEIFAVAAARKEPLTPSFLYGLILLPYFGWAGGTLLGAVMGNILPVALRDALGIAIYGMFLAIVLPPARKQKGILVCALASAGMSLLLNCFPLLSPGFAVIVCAALASVIAALFFPTPEEGRENRTDDREEAMV